MILCSIPLRVKPLSLTEDQKKDLLVGHIMGKIAESVTQQNRILTAIYLDTLYNDVCRTDRLSHLIHPKVLNSLYSPTEAQNG